MAWLRPKEVAAILGISSTHVLNLIKNGTIQGCKISPRVFIISSSALESQLKNYEVIGSNALLSDMGEYRKPKRGRKVRYKD